MRSAIPLFTTLGVLSALAVPQLAVSAADTRTRVGRLLCEYDTNPLGLDTRVPRLSWQLESTRRGERQTAYQLLVATTPERLRRNQADLWDSGRVETDRSVQVPYAGNTLASGQRCFWKVRVWDRDGRATPYSTPGEWEMALLNPGDWHGKWIAQTTDTAVHAAPLLRKGFTLRGPVRRARAYVSGLGYYELRLNGEKVGDHVLDPGYTRYDRRALYATYDVTKQLRQGENAVGLILGNGWHNVHSKAVWYFDRAPWRAAPKALLELRVEYTNGSTDRVVTDESWRTAPGPTVWDSIYGGETYDARQEQPGWDTAAFDASRWKPALVVEPPKGVLSAQHMPAIEVTGTLKPVKVTEPKPGVHVFDMGQNLAGFARLSVSGPAGTKVTLKYGERLAADGTLDRAGIAQHMIKDPPQRFQTDEYILKGGGTETWQPRFAYHGFQYVEVTGFPGKPTAESLTGCVVHTAVEAAGEFECSNPLLNRIQRNTRWSYVSNLHSIPTDCPHREKNGWTGDAHLAAELGIYNFHPALVYTKWIQDLHDEQRDSGELPGIVPTSGWGYEWGNGPAWDSAFLLIPWYLYEYYGDTGILAAHYDRMKRYVDYLTSKASAGIVSIGLGDWVAPGPTAPVEVTSTGYYYRDARIVADAAEILGKPEDARKYRALAEGIRRSFNARFLDPKTGIYSNGTQAAQSTPLYQDLAPAEQREAVLRNLVADVEKKGGHLDAGILGTKYLLNVLTDGGRADVAYRVATQKTYPSWGHWLEQGATTLWEDWKGQDSRNHVMFGDISAWFFRSLAGIRPDPSGPGFKRITIRPHPVGDLAWAKATYPSIHGRIESDWKRDAAGFHLRVVVPANSTATIYLPAPDEGRVTEGGRPIARAEGVRFLRREDDRAVYEVGSGEYRFLAPSGAQRTARR